MNFRYEACTDFLRCGDEAGVFGELRPECCQRVGYLPLEFNDSGAVSSYKRIDYGFPILLLVSGLGDDDRVLCAECGANRRHRQEESEW